MAMFSLGCVNLWGESVRGGTVRVPGVAKTPAMPGPSSIVIASGFESQCRVLCFESFPSWDEVQARLEAIQELL